MGIKSMIFKFALRKLLLNLVKHCLVQHSAANMLEVISQPMGTRENQKVCLGC